jgi:hypothetical protein
MYPYPYTMMHMRTNALLALFGLVTAVKDVFDVSLS